MLSVKSKKSQCSRGDSCSFSQGSNRGQRVQSCSLLLQMRSHKLTEENPRKVFVPKEKALQEEKAESRAKKSSNESVRTRRVIIGTFPYVKIISLRLDAFMAINAIFDILRRRKSPARSQSKVVRKDQLLQ